MTASKFHSPGREYSLPSYAGEYSSRIDCPLARTPVVVTLRPWDVSAQTMVSERGAGPGENFDREGFNFQVPRNRSAAQAVAPKLPSRSTSARRMFIRREPGENVTATGRVNRSNRAALRSIGRACQNRAWRSCRRDDPRKLFESARS